MVVFSWCGNALTPVQATVTCQSGHPGVTATAPVHQREIKVGYTYTYISLV